LSIDLQTHLKDGGTEKKQNEKIEKTTNTKQNLTLWETLRETRIDDLELTIDYNEGNDGTDKFLTNDMDKASQDETSEGMTPGLRNLQPSSTPDERNDTQEQMEGNTWPNGPEPEEEVSK
jgi:hypothetical protein